MQQEIDGLRADCLSKLEAATTTRDVEDVKVRFLGRKGPVQDLMKRLRDLDSDARRAAGKDINTLKQELETSCDARYEALHSKEQASRLEAERLDVTLPGRRGYPGRKHLVSATLDEILDAFVEMGFSIQTGPDVETDYYNFEALNFAPDHPARDMQDTFYITDDVLLRTHTSNTQVRVMESSRPPIRVVAPGRCYRNETITARSHVFFTQVEGFYIDRDVSFADLMGTIDEFLKRIFGRDVVIRCRNSYFPFVEPGMEVDIRCSLCQGKGCNMCKKSGWVEVLGSGMIHPEVLKNGGIDPEEFSGFAWGMGVERIVNIKHRVHDIRLLSENDMRFHEQFHAV